MNIYLTTHLEYDKATIYWIMAVASHSMVVMMPFWSDLSNRMGRRKVLAIVFVVYTVLVLPMMMPMNQQDIGLAFLAMVAVALPMPIVQSVGYPTYAEQSPTRVPYSGMAFMLQLWCHPRRWLNTFVATALIGFTGNRLGPPFLLTGGSAVALLALLGTRKTSRKARQ
ncbi:hypothetical protein CS8_034500 [Cupriavidus sp. 8B]